MSDCEEPCGWPVLDCQLSARIAALEAALAKADALAEVVCELQWALSEAREGQIVNYGESLAAYREARKATT